MHLLKNPIVHLLFLAFIASLFACGEEPPPPPTAAEKAKAKREFMPYPTEDLQLLKDLLKPYPQLKEFGYVFRDRPFMNEHLLAYDAGEISGFPVTVYTIDHEAKKYVESQHFPMYYKRALQKLNVDIKDFKALQKIMKRNYIEGFVNLEKKKLFFLDEPMGSYKGYLYTPLGRKGIDEVDSFFGVKFRIIKEFEKNWFGIIYP